MTNIKAQSSKEIQMTKVKAQMNNKAQEFEGSEFQVLF
jgi:hypothetical protein